MSTTLEAHERAELQRLAASASPATARHVRVILLSAEGRSAAAIAEAVGLSARQVYYWRRKWREGRLAIFMPNPRPAAPDPRGVAGPRLPLALPETPGIRPDDPMSEAGRKALLFHFERMLAREPATRRGEDIEALHAMRVATRRMRSALRVFGPFFRAKALRPFAVELRRAARTLGAVRDLDVLRLEAARFAAETEHGELAPLLAAWDARHADARQALLAYLDGADFANFVERFHAFLTTPQAGAKPYAQTERVRAYQVRHVAPRLIYTRYERVRAYETTLAEAPLPMLHALRIEAKRLRYALEFFAEVLGPEQSAALRALKGLQDHLGALNDARVAQEELQAFLAAYNTRYSGVPRFLRPDVGGVWQFLQAQRARQEHLRATLPQRWEQVFGEEARRALALAVAAL